ncbi:MAG: hypothetical protein ACK4S4_10620 [Pyrinomonadaceae bacterium]
MKAFNTIWSEDLPRQGINDLEAARPLAIWLAGIAEEAAEVVAGPIRRMAIVRGSRATIDISRQNI